MKKRLVERTLSGWRAMLRRCFERKNKDFHRYGGRGITVCDHWFWFENFLADMGKRPIGMTIDRINSDGNYEPDNCRWATTKEQSRNTCRNKFITHGAITLCVRDWEKILDVKRGTIRERLRRGWPLDKAVTLKKADVGQKYFMRERSRT